MPPLNRKNGIRFDGRNSRCKLENAGFHVKVAPINRIGVHMVIESN